MRSYCKFSISNMAAVRHLGFLKYVNFYLLHSLGSRSACSCKIPSCLFVCLHLTSGDLKPFAFKVIKTWHLIFRERWQLRWWCQLKSNIKLPCQVIFDLSWPWTVVDLGYTIFTSDISAFGHDVRVHAKFRRDCGCRVIASFRFPI